MTRVDVDLGAVELFNKAEYSSEDAVALLQYIAHKLRGRQPLTGDIRDFLAKALEATNGKTEKQAQRALGQALHLTTAGRRKEFDWLDAGEYFDELVKLGESVNSASSQVAADFEISERSARDAWKKFCDLVKVCQDGNPPTFN